MFQRPEAKLRTRLPLPARSLPGSQISGGASSFAINLWHKFRLSFGAKSVRPEELCNILSNIFEDRPNKGDESTQKIELYWKNHNFFIKCSQIFGTNFGSVLVPNLLGLKSSATSYQIFLKVVQIRETKAPRKSNCRKII